jgi:hypothetical protein
MGRIVKPGSAGRAYDYTKHISVLSAYYSRETGRG